jgi:hypothetical protein
VEKEARTQAAALVDLLLDDLLFALLGFVVSGAEVAGVGVASGIAVLVDPLTHLGTTMEPGTQVGVGRIQ